MGKALIKGTIVGSIILFLWMMISWMVLPWHAATLGKFSHEESVSSVIMANTSESGIYILPNAQSDAYSEAHLEAMKKGPTAFTAIRRDGFNPASPAPYINSFIIYLVGALIATFLLLQARSLSFGGRVWFITLFGVAVGVLANFPNWNWWGFSTSFTLVGFADYVIGWFLAGLGIAASAKR